MMMVAQPSNGSAQLFLDQLEAAFALIACGRRPGMAWWRRGIPRHSRRSRPDVAALCAAIDRVYPATLGF